MWRGQLTRKASFDEIVSIGCSHSLTVTLYYVRGMVYAGHDCSACSSEQLMFLADNR